MDKPYRHGAEYDFQKEKTHPLLAETEYYSGFVYKDIINKEYLRLNMKEDIPEIKEDIQNIKITIVEMLRDIQCLKNPENSFQELDIEIIAKLNYFFSFMNFSKTDEFNLCDAVEMFEEMFTDYLYISHE